MFIRDLSNISFPFLHNVIQVLSKEYSIESIYIDYKGELCITIIGKLSKDAIRNIIKTITPVNRKEDNIIPISDIDFRYTTKDSVEVTEVFSPDDIDYRTI